MNTDQNFSSFEVFNNTLQLIKSVRDDNRQQFDALLPHSNIDLMDHAVIHTAAQFNRQEILTLLLPITQTIRNPQGLLWSIEQNNVEVVALLAPHLEQSALCHGLRLADTNEIIDAIATHIYDIAEHTVKELCKKDNPYIFKALYEKMSQRVTVRAVMELLKNKNIAPLKNLMELSNGLFEHYEGNSYNNVVLQSVGSSVDGMKTILPYCDKNMYYHALRHSLSIDKYEHTRILFECHTYTNDEIMDLFGICVNRNDSQSAAHILNQYPIVLPHKTQLLGCAVRNNDNILFNTLFDDVDSTDEEDVQACHHAAWWASKRGYSQYLSILSQKIDLKESLETMYTNIHNKFKEQHYETLRDFVAQQQHEKIVTEIGASGVAGRRKM